MSMKDDVKAVAARLCGKEKPPSVEADTIRALSSLLSETGLGEIEIEQNGMRIRVARAGAAAAGGGSAMSASAAAAALPAATTPAAPHPGTVPSPMVGTVYFAPEPGKPAFIKLGQSVTEGDTLLIVEAMKTMNPITAPRSGTITEIHVKDAQPVEFGQALLVIG